MAMFELMQNTEKEDVNVPALARPKADGGYELIAVHPDCHNGSQNTHIHIVINFVRKYEGKKEKWHEQLCERKQGCKHKSTGKMMYHAKKWVMEQGILQGFNQVDLLAKKHTDNYWAEKRIMYKNAADGVGVTSKKLLPIPTDDIKVEYESYC